MVMLRRKKWLNVRLGGLDALELEHGWSGGENMEEAKNCTVVSVQPFLSHLSYGTLSFRAIC